MRVSFLFLRDDKKHIRVSMFLGFLLGNTCVFSAFGVPMIGNHARFQIQALQRRYTTFFHSALESLSSAQGYTAQVVFLFQTFHSFHSCAQQRIVETLSAFDVARRRHRLGHTVWRTDWCHRICGRSSARFRHGRGRALSRGVSSAPRSEAFLWHLVKAPVLASWLLPRPQARNPHNSCTSIPPTPAHELDSSATRLRHPARLDWLSSLLSSLVPNVLGRVTSCLDHAPPPSRWTRRSRRDHVYRFQCHRPSVSTGSKFGPSLSTSYAPYVLRRSRREMDRSRYRVRFRPLERARSRLQCFFEAAGPCCFQLGSPRGSGGGSRPRDFAFSFSSNVFVPLARSACARARQVFSSP